MMLIVNSTLLRLTTIPDIVDIHRVLGVSSVMKIQCSSDIVLVMKKHLLVLKPYGHLPLPPDPSILILALDVKTVTSHSYLKAEDTRVVPILTKISYFVPGA